ncbi:MAG: hypothetical protein ACLSAF_04055 [Intestinimonas sp.]
MRSPLPHGPPWRPWPSFGRSWAVTTSLGVSNISFGLPQREKVNAAFFLMALERGLSAAILNPNSAAMMDAFRAFCALNGQDANCQAYIAAMAGETSAPPDRAPAASAAPDLPSAVIRGLRESAVQAATGGACGKDADGDHRCRADSRPGPCGDRV